MLKKRFSKKQEVEKPETGDEGIVETGSELNETPEPEEDRTEENSDPDKIVDINEPNEVAETEEPDGETEMVALQKELLESKDKYLRLAAEFDNYRKRTLREKMDLIQNAGESLLKDILPVVDDFDRGIEVASKAEDMDAVRTGMNLIYNKLKDFLTNNGVKEIDAMHEPFDTDWHEAITNIPAPSDDMKGIIIDVIQKGYTLNDKIIRYPKVVVGE